MHKVKQLFGGKKDDNAHTNATTGEKVEPERRRSSIMRQILNPGGQKYDEQRLGAPETVAAIKPHGEDNPGPDALARDTLLKTDTAEVKEEAKTEHGVLRQILNPGGDKYDNEGYGTTAHAVGEVKEPAAGGTTGPEEIQRA